MSVDDSAADCYSRTLKRHLDFAHQLHARGTRPSPSSQLVHFSRGNKRIPLLASPPPPPHQLQSSWFVALGVNMRRRSRGSRVRVLHADKATRCCAIAGCVGKRNVFDLHHLRGVAFPPAYLKEHF